MSDKKLQMFFQDNHKHQKSDFFNANLLTTISHGQGGVQVSVKGSDTDPHLKAPYKDDNHIFQF